MRTTWVGIVTVLAAVLAPIAGAPPGAATSHGPLPADAVWVSDGSTVTAVDATTGTSLMTIDAVAEPSAVARSHDGAAVWVAGSAEVALFHPPAVAPVAVGTLPDPAVDAAYDPRDGSVWVVTAGELLHVTAAGDIAYQEAVKNGAVGVDLDPAPGKPVWVATTREVIAFHPAGVLKHAYELKPLAPGVGRDVSVEPTTGAVWVNTQKWVGTVLSGGLTIRLFRDQLEWISADGAGGAWAASKKDLFHVDGDGAVTQLIAGYDGAEAISALSSLADGSVWVASGERLQHVSSGGVGTTLDLAAIGVGRPVDIAGPGFAVDETPPVVDLQAPADGRTVFATEPLAAAVADWSDVTSVRFLVDGVEVAVGVPDGPGVWTALWDTTAAAEGEYGLTAEVTDRFGNVGTATGDVTVANDLSADLRLEFDYAAGLITLDDYVRFGTFNLLIPEIVPDRYGAVPEREREEGEDTVALLGYLAYRDDVDPATRAEIESVIERLDHFEDDALIAEYTGGAAPGPNRAARSATGSSNPAAQAGDPFGFPPVINEFLIQYVGGSTHDFVEILGGPLIDYTTYAIVVIEGDGPDVGIVDDVIPIDQTDGDGIWSSQSSGLLEDGTQTLLLVRQSQAIIGEDLDDDDDGNLELAPWADTLDQVAITDGDPGDHTYSNFVLEPTSDGRGLPWWGASRILDEYARRGVPGWRRNSYGGSGLLIGQQVGQNYDNLLDARNTPGAPNRYESPECTFRVCVHVSRHFRIHYAVPEIDPNRAPIMKDDPDPNTNLRDYVPDVIVDAAFDFDEVWDAYVARGFEAPPVPPIVSVRNTHRAEAVHPSWGGPRILIQKGLPNSTIRHETFHLFQFENMGSLDIARPDGTWFLESGANWASHVSRPQARHSDVPYAKDLDVFLAEPEADLARVRLAWDWDTFWVRELDRRHYGTFSFWVYLDREYPDVVRDTLKQIEEGGILFGEPVVDALDAVMDGRGTTTGDAVQKFWETTYRMDYQIDPTELGLWIDELRAGPTAGDTFGGPRPARRSAVLPSNGTAVTGYGELGWSGARFWDLTRDTGGTIGPATLDLTLSGTDVGWSLLLYDNTGYPNLCTQDPIRLTGSDTVQIPSGCFSGTLMAVHKGGQFATPRAEWAAVLLSAGTDLSVTLSGAPDPVTAGTQLTYQAVVGNAGPLDATNVTAVVAVPAGAAFGSASGASCAAVAGTSDVQCSLGTVAAGSSPSFDVVVDVDPATRGDLQAGAEVTATESDPAVADNTDTETTSVVAEADLSVTLAVAPDPAPIGTPVGIAATVTNGGPSSASNVTVAITYPTAIEVAVLPGACSATATGAECTFAQLAPQATEAISLDGRVAYETPDGTPIEVTVAASADETDPAAGNDSATFSTVAVRAQSPLLNQDLQIGPGSLATIGDAGARQGIVVIGDRVYVPTTSGFARYDLAGNLVGLLPAVGACTDGLDRMQDISTDGAHIYWTTSCNTYEQLWRTRLDNGQSEPVTTVGRFRPVGDVAIGPDGNAYVVFDNTVHKVDLATGSPAGTVPFGAPVFAIEADDGRIWGATSSGIAGIQPGAAAPDVTLSTSVLPSFAATTLTLAGRWLYAGTRQTLFRWDTGSPAAGGVHVAGVNEDGRPSGLERADGTGIAGRLEHLDSLFSDGSRLWLIDETTLRRISPAAGIPNGPSTLPDLDLAIAPGAVTTIDDQDFRPGVAVHDGTVYSPVPDGFARYDIQAQAFLPTLVPSGECDGALTWIRGVTTDGVYLYWTTTCHPGLRSYQEVWRTDLRSGASSKVGRTGEARQIGDVVVGVNGDGEQRIYTQWDGRIHIFDPITGAQEVLHPGYDVTALAADSERLWVAGGGAIRGLTFASDLATADVEIFGVPFAVSKVAVAGDWLYATDRQIVHRYHAVAQNPQPVEHVAGINNGESGSGFDSADGTGVGARFRAIQGMFSDGSQIWVVDAELLRTIDPAAGGPNAQPTLADQDVGITPGEVTTVGDPAARPGTAVHDGVVYVPTDAGFARYDIATGTFLVPLAVSNVCSGALSSAQGLTTDGAYLYWTTTCRPGLRSYQEVWRTDLATGASSKVGRPGEARQIGDVVVGPDLSVYAEFDGDIFVYDPATGALIRRISPSFHVTALAARSATLWVGGSGRLEGYAFADLEALPAVGSLPAPAFDIAQAPLPAITRLAAAGRWIYATDGRLLYRYDADAPNAPADHVAGLNQPGTSDGVGVEARFTRIEGITSDGVDTLWVNDLGTLRRIVQAPIPQPGEQPAGYSQDVEIDPGFAVTVDDPGARPGAVVFGSTVWVPDATGFLRYNLAGTLLGRLVPTNPGCLTSLDHLQGLTTDGSYLYWSAECRGTHSSPEVIHRTRISDGETTRLASPGEFGQIRDLTIGPDLRLHVIYNGDVLTYSRISGNLLETRNPAFTVLSLAADDTHLWMGGSANIEGAPLVPTATAVTVTRHPLGTTAALGSAGKWLYASDGRLVYRYDKDDPGADPVYVAGINAPGTADGIGIAARFSSVDVIAGDGFRLWLVDAGRLRRMTDALTGPNRQPTLMTLPVEIAPGEVASLDDIGARDAIALIDGVVYAPTSTGFARYDVDSAAYLTELTPAGACSGALDRIAGLTHDGVYLYWTTSCVSGVSYREIWRTALDNGETSRVVRLGTTQNVGSIVVGPDERLYTLFAGDVYEHDPVDGRQIARHLPAFTVTALEADATHLWVAGAARLEGWPFADLDPANPSNLEFSVHPFGNSVVMASAGRWLYASDGRLLYRYDKNLRDDPPEHVAGINARGGSDGIGVEAQFDNLRAIVSDGTDTLWAADDGRLRTIVQATAPVTREQSPLVNQTVAISIGTTSTVAGDGTAATVDGTGTAASLNGARAGVVVDGIAYVATQDSLRVIDLASAEVTTMAVSGTICADLYSQTVGMTTDGVFLYLATRCSSQRQLWRIRIDTGAASPVTSFGVGGTIYDVTYGPDGTLYVAYNDITRVDPITGFTLGSINTAVTPFSLAADSSAIWAAGGARLFSIDPADETETVLVDGSIDTTWVLESAGSYLYTGSTRQVTRYDKSAGSARDVGGHETETGYVDGTGGDVRFRSIFGLFTDGDGILVADNGNNVVRRISPP